MTPSTPEPEPEPEELPTVIGFTEEEVTERVAEAVAAKQVELTEKFEPRIKELENQLCEAQPKFKRCGLKFVKPRKKNFRGNLSLVVKPMMDLLRS